MKTSARLFGIVGALAAPAVALAADNEAQGLPEGLNWIAVLYSVVFVAAIAVVAFKNAKRTHLD